jgi:hypothetical protein
MRHLFGYVHFASPYHSSSNTKFKYYQSIDKNTRYRNKRVELETRSFYGQLLRVLVIKEPREAKNILLAVVQSIKVDKTPGGGNTTFYKEMGPSYVVDLNTVEGVVGRIRDRGCWAIVDRAPKSHA